MKITVLYDGWPVVQNPSGPAAQHLLTILALLPEQVNAVLALPGQGPDLRLDVLRRVHPVSATPLGHLMWVQSVLPRLARLARADLIHLTTPMAPLFGRTASLVSPAGYDLDFGLDISLGPDYPHRASRDAKQGFIERVSASLGRGGLVRAQAVLWPADLPMPKLSVRLKKISPIVHPGFSEAPVGQMKEVRAQLADLHLPETYVLYHGPGDFITLKSLVDAWSWATGPIGEYYPLLVMGLDGTGQRRLNQLVQTLDLSDTVRMIEPGEQALIPAIYQGCAALLHPAPASPWGGSVRQALACGKPVVAFDELITSEIVGPAAYLTPAGEARALAAALITVIVEEDVAKNLSHAARNRAAAWQGDRFVEELTLIYSDSFSAI